MIKKHYYKGRYKLKYPNKYKGNINNIIYRSSWERKFMCMCDTNSKIISWSSEELIIPYISPKDNQYHRYFIDFNITVRDKNNFIKNIIIEVKPLSQVYPPTKTGKKKSIYTKEVETYLINQAKWKAALEYCNKRNYEFIIATDKKIPKKMINEQINYKIWKIF